MNLLTHPLMPMMDSREWECWRPARKRRRKALPQGNMLEPEGSSIDRLALNLLIDLVRHVPITEVGNGLGPGQGSALPYYADHDDGVTGGIVGSSQRALRKLLQAAPPLLGILVESGALLQEQALAILGSRSGTQWYRSWLNADLTKLQERGAG